MKQYITYKINHKGQTPTDTINGIVGVSTFNSGMYSDEITYMGLIEADSQIIADYAVELCFKTDSSWEVSKITPEQARQYVDDVVGMENWGYEATVLTPELGITKRGHLQILSAGRTTLKGDGSIKMIVTIPNDGIEDSDIIFANIQVVIASSGGLFSKGQESTLVCHVTNVIPWISFDVVIQSIDLKSIQTGTTMQLFWVVI